MAFGLWPSKNVALSCARDLLGAIECLLELDGELREKRQEMEAPFGWSEDKYELTVPGQIVFWMHHWLLTKHPAKCDEIYRHMASQLESTAWGREALQLHDDFAIAVVEAMRYAEENGPDSPLASPPYRVAKATSIAAFGEEHGENFALILLAMNRNAWYFEAAAKCVQEVCGKHLS